MRLYFTLLVIICSQFVKSQSKIIGTVQDSAGIALDHASVIVLNPKDSSIIAFSMTDKQGIFSIHEVILNQCLLQINYTGYTSYWSSIELSKNNSLLDVGTIVLQLKEYPLPLMEIKAAQSPIKFGNDTIEYNAEAFKIQAGDIVEDLLKKLPGIEVERDGSVKAYGENVQNILVDGKEFFGKDTRIATKNLEANAVDKVQVFDKKSDQATFTGVDDGREEKTINLQLKENKKQGYFGNASGGAGTSERYVGRLNINRFSPKTRFSIIGNTNNINDQGFSIEEYIQFMGGIGAFMSGGSGRIRLALNDDSAIPVIGNGQIAGIQNVWAGGLNYSTDISSKTEMTGSFFFSKLANTLLQNTLRQSIGNYSQYNITENKKQYSNNQNKKFNLHSKHRIDSGQQIIFKIDGGYSQADLENALQANTVNTESELLNASQSDYFMNGNNYQINSSLAWMKRLGKTGRSLASKLSGRFYNNERNGNLMSENYFYIISNIPDLIHQRHELIDKSLTYEGSLHYTEPLGSKKYLEFNVLHSNNIQNTKYDYFDDLGNNHEQKNDLLSRKYKSDYSVHSAGLNILINKKKYHLTGGCKIQYSSLTGKLQSMSEASIANNYKRILPMFFGEYQFGTANRLNFEYQTFLQEPSIVQLQPAVNNSDPLNVYIGNPKLNPEYRHDLNATYFLYDQFNFTSLFTTLSGGYTMDKITDIVHVDSAFRRTIQPMNVAFEKNIKAGIDFNTPIRPLKINARIKLGTGISKGIFFVNDEKDELTKLKSTLNFTIENRNKDVVDALIGWKTIHSKTKYSLNSMNNLQFSESGIYAEFTIAPSRKLSIKSSFEFKRYQSSFFTENITVSLWELSISHFFLKDNKLKLQLKIFDLLNENIGIRRTSQLNFIEEVRSNAIGRYAMFQIAYAIRGFSDKKDGIEIKINN